MFTRTPVAPAAKRESTFVSYDTQAVPSVTLTLKLPPDSAPALCRAVSRALRRELDVYMSASDRITGHATLQLILLPNEPAKVMQVVMQTVPSAEFGYVQHVRATAVH